ncbi:MAG TPA: bifunctional diguanylate cyclase/phosphodiesterase, partial [Thermohalobaculum sp.]|nr:bifunctional diguanylate cyclase/phosphodiesterase [Thermohalobaculum sp.]
RCRAQLASESGARREAERQARTDPVTGLLNRRGLSAAFDSRRRPLGERDLVITVLMFEIDRLEQVRAAEGPEGVAATLARVAAVLPAVLRDEDDAGRIDGGRFVVVLAAPRYSRAPGALARRLQEAVAAAPELACLGERMTLSVGIAQTAAATMPFERMLAEAELALRAARLEGDGRVVPFEPSIAAAQARRSAALHTAGEAFAGSGLQVRYQPIVALEDRRICAVEAVAKIEQRGGAPVDAAVLGRAAGDPGLACRLARHVQTRAIADMGRLQREGVSGVCLAMKVAERQLADPAFAEALLDQLILEGLSASDLWLEMSEEVFLTHRLPSVLDTLERLAAAGAECGIDGFGSGYASLAQLRRAPLTWIKLDPALVNEIAADDAAREIASAARTMAAALDKRVCADGIETAAVAEVASEIGFDCAQGAYFCHPVPLSELDGIIRRGVAA